MVSFLDKKTLLIATIGAVLLLTGCIHQINTEAMGPNLTNNSTGNTSDVNSTTLNTTTINQSTDNQTNTSQNNTSVNSTENESQPIVIEEIKSGSSISIRYPNNTTKAIYLAGLRLPKESDTDRLIRDDFREDCWREWGGRALEYLNNNYQAGDEVEVEIDRESYGLIYGYITHEETLINEELLREGYVTLNTNSIDKKEQFNETKHQAWKNTRGLWQCQKEPSQYHPSPELVVKNVQVVPPDPDYDIKDATENPSLQHVVLENQGDAAADLSGLYVDVGGVTGKSELTGIVDPGESITIYMGGYDELNERPAGLPPDYDVANVSENAAYAGFNGGPFQPNQLPTVITLQTGVQDGQEEYFSYRYEG